MLALLNRPVTFFRKSVGINYLGIHSSLSSPQQQALREKKSTEDPHIRPFEDIPEVEGLPIIGSILDYSPLKGFKLEYVDKLWTERHNKYGDIFKEKALGRDYVVYCRAPGDTERMFRNEGRLPFRTFVEVIALVRKKIDILDSIVNMRGEEWYRFRKVINPLLLQHKMIWKYIEDQQGVCQDLVSYIKRNLDEKGEVPKFSEVLDRWSFEMGGTFLLSTRLGLLGHEPEKDRVQAVAAMAGLLAFVASSQYGFPFWKYFNTKQLKDVVAAQKIALGTFRTIIDDFMARTTSNDDPSMLQRIMESTELEQDEKYVILYDLMSAAIETTSKASALVLYCVTLKPEIQEKLREEIFRSSGEKLTGRVIDGMKYLNAFLKEVVRLYPFVVGFSRHYDKDIVLSGYRIPAGTCVNNTSNSTYNRDPRFFPNPDEFLPERWMESDASSPDNRFVLTGGFGVGARACPGRRFAMQEIRLLVIELLKEFKIEYHHKPIVSIFRATGSPSEAPQFKFIPFRS